MGSCGTCLFDEVQHFIEEEQTIALEQRSNGGAAAMFRDTTCVQTSQGDNTVFGGADLNGTGAPTVATRIFDLSCRRRHAPRRPVRFQAKFGFYRPSG